jgi:hypothetical protein
MPFYLKDRDIFSDIAMVHSALTVPYIGLLRGFR